MVELLKNFCPHFSHVVPLMQELTGVSGKRHKPEITVATSTFSVILGVPFAGIGKGENGSFRIELMRLVAEVCEGGP
jgi:hypothetical protein